MDDDYKLLLDEVRDLIDFMGDNLGSTDDWPLRICNSTDADRSVLRLFLMKLNRVERRVKKLSSGVAGQR